MNKLQKYRISLRNVTVKNTRLSKYKKRPSHPKARVDQSTLLFKVPEKLFTKFTPVSKRVSKS